MYDLEDDSVQFGKDDKIDKNKYVSAISWVLAVIFDWLKIYESAFILEIFIKI